MYIGVTKNLFDNNKSVLKTQDNLSMDNIQLNQNNYQNMLGYNDWKICISDYDSSVQDPNTNINNIYDNVGVTLGADIGDMTTYGVHEFEVIFTRAKDYYNSSDTKTNQKVDSYIYYNSYKSNGNNTGRAYTGNNSFGSIGEYDITLFKNADANNTYDYDNLIKNSKFMTYSGSVIGLPFRNVANNARVQRNIVGYYNKKSTTNTYASNLNNFIINITPSSDNHYTKSFSYNTPVNTICDIRNMYEYSGGSYLYNERPNTYLGYPIEQPDYSYIDAFYNWYISGTHLNTITVGSTNYYQIQNALRFRIDSSYLMSNLFTNDRSCKWIVSASDIIYTVAKGKGSSMLNIDEIGYMGKIYTWRDTNATVGWDDTVFYIIKNRVTTDTILNVYKSSIDELAERYTLTSEIYTDHATMTNNYDYPNGTTVSNNSYQNENTNETVYTKSNIELQRRNDYQDTQGNTHSEWVDVKQYQIANTTSSAHKTTYDVEQEFNNLLDNTTYRYRVTNFLKNTNLWSLKSQGGITSPVLDVLVNQYKDGIPYTYQWHEFSVNLPSALTHDFLINQCSVESTSTCDGYINIKCKFNNKYAFELNNVNQARSYQFTYSGTLPSGTTVSNGSLYLSEITGEKYLKLHDFNDVLEKLKISTFFGIVNNSGTTISPIYIMEMTNNRKCIITYESMAIYVNCYVNGNLVDRVNVGIYSDGTATNSNNFSGKTVNVYNMYINFKNLISGNSISDADFLDDAVVESIYFQGYSELYPNNNPTNLFMHQIKIDKYYDLDMTTLTEIFCWTSSESDNPSLSTIGTNFMPFTTELELRPYGELALLRKRESDNSSDFSIIVYHKLWQHNYSENTVHWIGDNEFEINDVFVPNGAYYIYAIGGYRDNEVNKNILKTTEEPSICTCNRFMISDKHKTFTFIANVQYGSFEVSSQTTYQVAKNRQYPYIMDNSYDKFNTGTLSMDITGESFLIYNKLDKSEIETEIKNFIDFLKSKTTKVIKDWNGKSMMIYILPQPSYSVNLANDLHKITFNFVEVGNLDNEEDLEENDTLYSSYDIENQPDFSTETEV